MRITGYEYNCAPGEHPTATINVVVNGNDLNKIGEAYAYNREVYIQENPSFNEKCWETAMRRYGYTTYTPSNIKRVIFHDPATIVFWTDGTKTVVKTGPDDTYNPEVGLAMCISKKVLGDGFHHEFKKWLKEETNGNSSKDN